MKKKKRNKKKIKNMKNFVAKKFFEIFSNS